MNLDVKDKRILAALDKDSRVSFSELSKKTGMPQETVRYRFGQLMKSGIIEHCPSFINGPKLGYTYYEILFKLHNVNRAKFEELVAFLCKQPRIGWVAELEGSYDIAIIVSAKHQLELQRVIDTIYATYSDRILSKQLSINLWGEIFPREYFLNEKRAFEGRSTVIVYQDPIVPKQYEIDLCRALALNSRASVVDLAKQLNVSAETIVQAIRRLRKQNIILGHTIVMRLEKIGISHYKILLTLNNVTEKDKRSLEQFARGRARILGIFRSLADYDYQIDVEVESVQQLREITMELNEQFSHIIHDYEVLRISHMPKYQFFP